MKNCLIISLMLVTSGLSAQNTSVTTVKETKQIVERIKDGKKWVLTLKNYEIESLLRNGKIIPHKDYSKYQNVIDALRAAANGSEMPSEVSITEKGIPTTSSTYEHSESGALTPEQKYVNWKIEEALRNDKIFNNNGKAFQLLLTEKSMTVNGTEMAKDITDKYIALYYTYSGEQRCATCTFKLSLNRQVEKSAGW